MASATPCSICKTRKPRRTCPVEGEICTQCCGRDREETIDCPLDCPALIESRMHAKSNPIDTSLYRDLQPSEEFVGANRGLFMVTALGLFGASLETPGCNDQDIVESLDAAIQNRRTRLNSGLIYESKPDNRIAAEILEKFDKRIDEFAAESAKWESYRRPADREQLQMMVFLRLLASSHVNGRRKGRAFLHFLYGIAAQNLPAEGPE